MIHFATIELLRSLAQRLYNQGAIADAQTVAAAITEVVQATGDAAFYADTFFGGCPCCGDCEEVLNIGGKRYAVCHEHRLYWYIGACFLPASSDVDKHIPQSHDLFLSYTQISAKQAFPHDVCPCCGFSIEHALWCTIPGPRRP